MLLIESDYIISVVNLIDTKSQTQDKIALEAVMAMKIDKFKDTCRINKLLLRGKKKEL